MAAVVADFGFVDILVNNAGVASRGRAVADTDADEVERLLRTHARRRACACAGPSSLDAHPAPGRHRDDLQHHHPGRPRPNGAPYAMAKAALEILAATLAKEELRHGIHVNVVAPGLVETDMGRRLAKATLGHRRHPGPRRLLPLRPGLRSRRRRRRRTLPGVARRRLRHRSGTAGRRWRRCRAMVKEAGA